MSLLRWASCGLGEAFCQRASSVDMVAVGLQGPGGGRWVPRKQEPPHFTPWLPGVIGQGGHEEGQGRSRASQFNQLFWHQRDVVPSLGRGCSGKGSWTGGKTQATTRTSPAHLHVNTHRHVKALTQNSSETCSRGKTTTFLLGKSQNNSNSRLAASSLPMNVGSPKPSL